MALLLSFAALYSDVAGKSYFSKALSLRTKALIGKSTIPPEVAIFQEKGDWICRFGIFLALAGLVFWIVSERRNEPAWRSIPFAVLIVYVMELMMLV